MVKVCTCSCRPFCSIHGARLEESLSRDFTEMMSDEELNPKVPLYGIIMEGGSIPRKYHTSLESAQNEAKRLVAIEDKPATIIKRIMTVKPLHNFTMEYF